MSYILEALKKAQAERQLGNAPTIHAPTISPAPQSAGGRKPLVIGFAAGAVLVAGALFAWRQQPPASGQTADAGKGQTRVAVASQPVAQQTPAASPAQASQPAAPAVPATAPAAADATARVALVQDSSGAAQASAVPPRPRTEHAPQPKPVASVAAPVPSPAHDHVASQPVPVPAAAAKPAAHDVAAAPPASTVSESAVVARQAAVTPAPSADEALRTVNELPEQIRFSVPKVAFGGYMYSPNPADRLVLVDKALRHEGEEVAPGLVLEKLLPKAAVMNYRGYRYRVPL